MKRNEKGQFVKTHGHWIGNIKPPLYSCWRAMRRRCHNPKDKDYHNYGERGIYICERWLDFGKFFEDMMPTWKPSLTLGRINNDGPYSPENCRWETQEQQNCNRRDNRLITHDGVTRTASQWARCIGIQKETFFSRIRRGLTGESLMLPSFIKPKARINVEMNGITKSIPEWSKELGIKEATLRRREKHWGVLLK